jgi:hypothetical protein
VAVAAVVALMLTGCFGPDKHVLIDQAHDDFDGLVAVASAVDEAVLHTLEVEKPSSETCDPESKDAENTVFIAAGTMAIQSADTDEFDLLEQFRPSFDDRERWTRVRDLGEGQLAWVDVDGITASVKVEDGLLVIAVFSPCRS